MNTICVELQPRLIYLLLVAGLVAGGCTSRFDDGLVKHQVSGSVQLNGALQPGIAVVFNHTDSSVTLNAARPVAVTDEAGRFALSTNGPQDGAVQGEYVVTFFWPRGGTSTQDFLKGKYTSVASSKFRVTVGDSDTELEPFQLEAPEAEVAAARKVMQKPALPN